MGGRSTLFLLRSRSFSIDDSLGSDRIWQEKELNLLLTGTPGIGKTTLMRRVAKSIGHRPVGGFLTDEIRQEKRRLGFRLETFNGQEITLAHVELRSRHHVGKYGVDVEALDRIIDLAFAPATLYLIDEIGKMECLSPRFVATVVTLLEGARPVIATVALKGAGFISEVKNRPDIELWQVTFNNRDQMPEMVLKWLGR